MTCCLLQYRASVGMFYARACRLSIALLSFITTIDLIPALLLLFHGSSALSIALFLFVTCFDPFQRETAHNCSLPNSSPQTSDNSSSTFQHKDTASPKISIFLTLIISILLHLSGDIQLNPGPQNISFSGLSICHLNAHSIRNKTLNIQSELSCFDIITVSETWLSDNISNDNIIIPGFQPPIRCDRPDQAYGGVAVYVRNNLVCKARPDLSIPHLEAVWIETRLGQEPLLVGTFYRAPGSLVAYWNLIDQSVQLAGNTTSKYIILGDFNADCTLQPPQHLQDLMTTNNLYQVINKPTHISENFSTTIDIILTPCPDFIQASDVLPPVCSDHSVPYIVLKNKQKTHAKYKRTFYDYGKINAEKTG